MNEGTRTLFFSGIGGIGMSALAQLHKERGDTVMGSDREESPVTELLTSRGISVIIGQSADNLPESLDVLVYSDAVPEDSPERAAAAQRGIPQLSYFEMLGSATDMRRTVAVAGTHGKTTTTGMLTRILVDTDARPSAVIGSIVRDFGSNYVSGDSDLFVVEACEYKRHFLHLSPEILVVTNIEFDHSDYFTDLADVQNAFRTLMERVPASGAIICDTEHPNVMPLLPGLAAPVFNYLTEPAYALQLPGAHNEMNARAAACAAKAVLPESAPEDIGRALLSFTGTWRRFEDKGKTRGGARVIDDYAHHPTAVKETLRAVREQTLGRVLVAFHPHLYSRTRDLLDGFARAFGDADEVLIAPIYGAREIDDGSVSSDLLASRIREEGGVAHAASFAEIEAALRKNAREGDTIVTMGAGDIYKVSDALVS